MEGKKATFLYSKGDGDSGGVEDALEESVVMLRQLCEMRRAGPGATGEPQPLNWVTN